MDKQELNEHLYEYLKDNLRISVDKDYPSYYDRESARIEITLYLCDENISTEYVYVQEGAG